MKAAPKMLASLREVRFLVTSGAMEQFKGEPWIARLDAAIAEATGEQ